MCTIAREERMRARAATDGLVRDPDSACRTRLALRVVVDKGRSFANIGDRIAQREITAASGPPVARGRW